MAKFMYKYRHKGFGKIVCLALLFCLFCLLGGLGFFLSPIFSDAANTYPKQFCLRDDYYIGLTDQGQFGNCWTFANLKSVENYLAQTTGEHFELNESYIAMTRSLGPADDRSLKENIIGAGGSVNDFINAINTNGITTDTEFGYENFYYVNETNRDYLIQNMKKSADTDTIEISDVEAIYYNNNRNNMIKSFLIDNKNASINISNWALYRTSSGNYEIVKGTSGAHALCVIGWDDNYLSAYGGRGAYLILNSYGLQNSDGNYSNEGILYLPYSTSLSDKSCTAFSYVFDTPDDYVTLSSNANYTVQTKGNYYSSTGFTGQETTLKDKNIFDVDDDFELDYSFPQKENLNYSLKIWRGKNDVSSDFYILKDDTNCYVYRKNPLESGAYRIDINYSYTQNSQRIERHLIKQLFLLDGLEFDLIDGVLPEYRNMNNQIQAGSLSLGDSNIYIPQSYHSSGVTELRLAMSPYSSLTGIKLTKNGALIPMMQLPNTKNFISLVIPSTYLFNSDNVFDLTLTNQKHEKTYKIHIAYDQSQKFATLFNVDLGGGQVEQNYPSQILLTSGVNSNHFMYVLRQIPQKEGFEFADFQYLDWRDGEWKSLGQSPSGYFYVTADMISKADSNNYFTLQYGGSNFKNFLFVRARYTSANVIQIDSDTFDFGQPILSSINLPNAQNIVWFLDDKQVGTGESVTLENLMPNNYCLTVQYTLAGTQHSQNKTIYVKNHVFDVHFDKVDFVYDAILQRPTVTVDDLSESAYQIDLPESIEAGQYCVTLSTSAKNIKLSQYKIEYTIQKRPLQVEFDSQLIEEPGAPIAPVTYRVTNWSENESDDLQVTFLNLDQISTEIAGDFAVQYRFENVGDSYEVVVTEQPYIYVKFDFDADAIDLCTSSVKREQQDEFVYGQNFVISFDCPSGMIESVQYTLDGKEYSIKQQYIDEKLPVGEYDITAKATLINGQTIEKTKHISIVVANITIVLDDQKSMAGEQTKPLTYHIVSEYEDFSVYGINITPFVESFDSSTPGEYSISARVTDQPGMEGAKENYNITIVKGKYVVEKERPLNWLLVIILIVIVAVAIAILVALMHKTNKKHKKYDNA